VYRTSPSSTSPRCKLTLLELAEHFFQWLDREVAAQRSRPATSAYYRRMLKPLIDLVGDHQVDQLRAWDLERVKTGWHSVQAAQRLLNWSQRVGLASDNPFNRVAKPRPGCRSTILRAGELELLRRRASPELRAILLAQVLTAARPGEIRGLHWFQYRPGPHPHFVLNEFKARDRRGDRRQVRVLPVVPRLARLLGRLARRRPSPASHVFTNVAGEPWTGDALSRAFRRLRRRLGLADDLVPYSIRHTSATRACVAGVRDRLLAELLGHTSTRTTARYLHPDVAELLEVAQRMSRRHQKGR
jgi:integrase